MMRKLAVLFACTLAFACGHHDKAKVTSSPLGDAQAQAGLYQTKAQPLQDPQGFVDIQADKCDGLLWSCLAYASGSTTINYAAAQDPATPGLWFRDSERTCGPSAGTSATTISKDMLLGLALCLWQSGDISNAKAVVHYADAHQGVMGEGDASITSIGPLVYYLFTSIVARVEKTPLPPRPANPDPYAQSGQQFNLTDPLVGYRAHLVMLGVLLDGLIQGGISDLEMSIVKDQAKRQPDNALYQTILHKYTDGDQSAALATLANKQYFPTDRLPQSSDRSTLYLWQRDEGTPDWAPDTKTDPPTVFSGTDYRFAVAVISGTLREAK